MLRELRLLKRDKKLFEYFRNLNTPSGFVFLQETHSSVDVQKQWNDDFQAQLFLSHRKTNSCGVAIDYYGKKKVFQTSEQI